MTSPTRIPLPPSPNPFSPPSPLSTTSLTYHSPSLPFPRRPSLSLTHSDSQSRRSSASHTPSLQQFSPRTSAYRPRFDRSFTAIRRDKVDPFHEGTTIEVNQPVGSLSISPSNRDVCLASRKGLYIIDLANLNNAPRFIPQGGTWQIADVQWSPHPVTSNLILSTSSQKLLVWDLIAQTPLHRSIDAHTRAITDINWHARDPNIMATVSMDAGIRGWDLRALERPVMRLCAWGQAGTQVKWNRQHDHLLATAHGKEVLVWDNRKGSVPVVAIKAHDAKIYGLDWDRQWRHKLVTCSLDKTVKYWTVPDLRTSAGATDDAFYPALPAPSEPTSVIRTSYPVWRARNLPFGHGVLCLPQRGSDNLEMFALGDETPVQTFEGHSDVIKDFVWRSRGGGDANFENREFQLVTWSKDHTLRIWPVPKETAEKVGYQYGAPIQVLVSRRGAKDITYTTTKCDMEQKKDMPLPIVNPPSGIAKAKTSKTGDVGMTRGRGKVVGMDQLDWLTKVVKNKASPDSSVQPSRMGSISRAASRSVSRERRQSERGVSVGFGERDGLISLKDEVVLVNRLFPRPRINFEKIDLHHRKLTMSMLGPWANGERMAFIRIHWQFPISYPYSPDIPTFELERNPTISPIVRQDIVMTLKSLRAENRQCLVTTCSYLIGEHQRLGRTRVNLDDDSDSETGGDMGVNNNVVMLTRTSGATFGPNGELVCFFPKQTVLPRIRALSRSPSVNRPSNPLLKAMMALSHLSSPGIHNPRSSKPRPKIRRARLEIAPQAIQAGSTMTIHDTSSFGNPSADLARAYGIPGGLEDLEKMLAVAAEKKRLDHVLVLEALRGVLEDPPPPPYSRCPPYEGVRDQRLERDRWERGVACRKEILDQIFDTLIALRDFQMLALVSILVLRHIRTEVIPPLPETLIAHSPETDYFGLPRISPHLTPSRSRTSLSATSPGFGLGSSTVLGMQPIGTGSSVVHRNSSFSVYGSSTAEKALSSGFQSFRAGSGSGSGPDRGSFDVPYAKTPIGFSIGEDGGSHSPGLPPGGGSISAGLNRAKSSPRVSDLDRRRHRDSDSSVLADRTSRRPTHLSMGTYPSGSTSTSTSGFVPPSSSETTPTPGDRLPGPGPGPGPVPGHTPLKSADTERTLGSVGSTAGAGSSSGMVLGRHHSAGHIGSSGAGSSGWNGGGNRGSAGSPARMRRRGEGGRVKEVGNGKRGKRICGVRIELISATDRTDEPTLLPPSRLGQCEAWKLAYADFLLRSQLYGLRAELMAVHFSLESMSTGMPGLIGNDQAEKVHDGISVACVACNRFESCPACHQKPISPLCSYCRLPIKGLSTTCAICTHKTHFSCLRLHTRSSAQCPACPCRCVTLGGLTSGNIAFKSSPSNNLSLSIPSEDINMTYTTSPINTAHVVRANSGLKSWTVLDRLREQDRAAAATTSSNTHTHPGEIHHRSSFGAFGSPGPGLGALGLGFDDTSTTIGHTREGSRGTEGDDEGGGKQGVVGAERERDEGRGLGHGAAGILARARAVMDSGTGWRSHGM